MSPARLLHVIAAMGPQFKPCHNKTGLKIFVVVIPKEGLAAGGPAIPKEGEVDTSLAKPIFDTTLTMKYNLLVQQSTIL